MFQRLRYAWSVFVNNFPLDAMECILFHSTNFCLQSAVVFAVIYYLLSYCCDFLSLLSLIVSCVMALSFLVSVVMIFQYQKYSAWKFYLLCPITPIKRGTKRAVHHEPLYDAGEAVLVEGPAERSSCLV